MARKIVPWACVAAGWASPSGLQNSHIATPSATSRPQRTQFWVGSSVRRTGGAAGPAGGVSSGTSGAG